MQNWINKLRLLKLFPFSISRVIPSFINQEMTIPKIKDNKTDPIFITFGILIFIFHLLGGFSQNPSHFHICGIGDLSYRFHWTTAHSKINKGYINKIAYNLYPPFWASEWNILTVSKEYSSRSLPTNVSFLRIS